MVRDVTMKPPSVADAAALPSAEVARTLGVSPGAGLDPEEVARRAAEAGVNELQAVERESVLGMLRDAATEPFVYALRVTGRVAVG